MPTKDPEKRRAARLRRKARDPEKYFAVRRAQKLRARERKALLNPKVPKTHCANGHPEDRNARGVCRACLRATKKRRRDALRAAKPPAPPRDPALTSAQKRAADPEGYRAKERARESERLGHTVLPLTDYLKSIAKIPIPKVKKVPLTPEEKAAKALLSKRRSVLLRKGWTPEMYDTTFAEQGGRCMVCRKPSDRGPLCADHAHTEPPEPRALLCHHCNTALGLLRDSPGLCRAAAEYLEAWV